MPKKIYLQTAFNNGEISPRLYSRVNVQKYDNSVETATNCECTPHGPIKRRNGTKYIASVKTASKKVRLIKFQLNKDIAQILELGDSYIRFYTTDGQVSGPYEISSPYDETEVQDITYVQDGAKIYLAHPSFAPRVLTRIADGDWSLATLSPVPEPTYEKGEYPSAVGRPLATTGLDKTFVAGLVSIVNSSYQWTASGSGTNEYYLELSGGGDPSISSSNVVIENNALMTEGTAGSLSAGEWDYGDNDTLGYDTIYVRLTDNTDPDSKADDYVEYSNTSAFLQGDVGRQIVDTTGTGRGSITKVESASHVTMDIISDYSAAADIASGSWYMDLSPIADLTSNGTYLGSVVTVTSEYPDNAKGDRVAISNITSGGAVVTTSSAHGLIDGDLVYISDVVGPTVLNGETYMVESSTSTTFVLSDPDTGNQVNLTNHPAYSSGGYTRKVFSDTLQATFRSTDVGRYIIMNNGVIQITEYTDSNTVQGEVLKALDSLDETGNWTLEDPTWSSTRGYPRAVGIFQDRLCFGGTSSQPQTLWMSESGLFDSFGRGSNDDDSIDVTLSASTAAQINWMATARNFIIGTSGTEHTVDGGSATAAITPSNIRQEPRSYRGGPQQVPLIIGSEVIFYQNSLRKIRSFRYDFDIDGYRSEDLTFLAEHITEGNIKEIAYAQEPDSQIFAVLNTGELIVGTYLRSQEVLGWTKFTTDGSFENVQTITSGDHDEVWVCVKRTINGATARYVEKFDFSTGEDRLDGFSDSYLTYSDPKTISSITKANPGVVTTSSAHGYNNGDKVKLISVGGMTELENTTFLVANKTSTTFELEELNNRSIRNSSYQWTASGSGTSEYYLEASGGGDPGISEPASVYANDTLLTEATAGSLSASEWDWADNDSLGFSTVYIRLADSTDPDTKINHFVEYSLAENTSSYTTYTSGGEAHKLVTTISGLSHLEATTVQIKADGAAHPDKTVSSGSISLDRDSYEVTVGLKYTTTIKTLSLNHDIGLGSMRGQRSRHIRPILEVYKSSLPTMADTILPSRSTSDNMDKAVPLTSGFLEYGSQGWSNTYSLTITISEPLPLQLLGIFSASDGGVK